MSDPMGVMVLLATEAYGMGADPPDVRRVQHVSSPTNMESKSYLIVKETQNVCTEHLKTFEY